MSTHKDWTLLVWGEHIQGHPEDAAHNIVCGPHCALVASIPLGSSASTHGDPGETVITEAEALEHARLIAAAPDMLEALRECRVWLAGVAGQERRLALVDAAIAEATGEQA